MDASSTLPALRNTDKDQARWAANLAALRSVNAELAPRLAAMRLPDEWVPTTGRDGCDTYRLVRSDGSGQWFGRTSMPGISAPALLSRFEAGNGNVALYCVGHGAEVSLLLMRLPANRAVFVLEPHLTQLALALRLHDWTQAIGAGQLVLLAGDNLFDQLTVFLTANEGYLPPQRLLSWPWIEPAETKPITTAFEQANRQVESRRAQETTAIRQQWSAWPVSADLTRPLIVATQSSSAGRAWAQELRLAAGELGYAAESIVCDNPARMHCLAMYRAIEAHRPTGLLLLDHFRGQATEGYPANVAAVTWLGPDAWPTCEANEALGEHDVAAAVSSVQAKQLAARGIASERITIVPLAASSWAFEMPPPPDDADDMALLADAVPTDADAHGWRLTSQRVLWDALVGILSAEAAAFTCEQSERILRRAEQRSGVRLAEESIRREFLERIERLLGPTLLVRVIAEHLSRAGLRLGLWGRGWQAHESVRECWRGAAADAEQRRQAVANSRMVIEATCDGHVSQLALDAAAAGRVVLARAHPKETEPGELSAMLRCGQDFLRYDSLPRFVRLLQELLASPQRMTTIGQAAHESVCAGHTYSHRLRQLADRIVSH